MRRTMSIPKAKNPIGLPPHLIGAEKVISANRQ